MSASKKPLQTCAGALKDGSISLTCILHCGYFNDGRVNERTIENTSTGELAAVNKMAPLKEVTTRYFGAPHKESSGCAFIKPELELDIHCAANAPWWLRSFDSGPSVLRSCSVAGGGRVCSYCAAPTCECNCNCMNMKQNLAVREHRGLFDFSWEIKGQINVLLYPLGLNNLSRPHKHPGISLLFHQSLLFVSFIYCAVFTSLKHLQLY